MNIQAIFGIISIVFVVLLVFAIYVSFKLIEFVVSATNLYKKMIARQDAMIKLLKDIRGEGAFDDDLSVVEQEGFVSSSGPSFQRVEVPGGPGHHWGPNDKTHDVVKKCPNCGGIFHGAEFASCGKCECALAQA